MYLFHKSFSFALPGKIESTLFAEFEYHPVLSIIFICQSTPRIELWWEVELLSITAIPRDMLPLDMLTPQIRHYELRQKNSRYANFSDFLPPAMLFLIFFQKNSRYANFSDLSTPSYAIFD